MLRTIAEHNEPHGRLLTEEEREEYEILHGRRLDIFRRDETALSPGLTSVTIEGECSCGACARKHPSPPPLVSGCSNLIEAGVRGGVPQNSRSRAAEEKSATGHFAKSFAGSIKRGLLCTDTTPSLNSPLSRDGLGGGFDMSCTAEAA